MDIGKRIVEIRSNSGMTTNKLANLCGLSQSFLRSVEMGEKGISVDSLSLVCDALNISLRDFFDVPEQEGDSIQVQISRLTTEQKDALAAFLKTMQ